jgi:holo-[acyl-carrier protein] synthase
MIHGIGIDIIETDRIKNQIEKDGDRFYKKIFTKKEIEYCMRGANVSVQAQRFAGRFAAKEAFFKAVGTGLRNDLRWIDVEIVNDELGRPMIIPKNATLQIIKSEMISNIQLSISHDRQNATAVVVLEKE